MAFFAIIALSIARVAKDAEYTLDFAATLGGKLVARAGPDALEADVAAFKDVRAHFFANGRAWTKGAAYPDGYNVSG